MTNEEKFRANMLLARIQNDTRMRRQRQIDAWVAAQLAKHEQYKRNIATKSYPGQRRQPGTRMMR